MKTTPRILALAITLATAATVHAVEDGLGTNHVRTLRAYDGIVLGTNPKITNWLDVSATTLTNQSISTAMLQDNAVTTGKIATAVAGDGLIGGGAAALAVGQGDGITVTADAVAVDATVVRTDGAQSIDGIKTFVESPVIPDPTLDTHAATKLYVDTKLPSSVSSGQAAGQTLRWDGNAWTNTGGIIVTATSNTILSGSVTASGAVTVASTVASTNKDTGALVVEGGVGIEQNLNVGGTAGIVGNVTIAATTASTDKDSGALVVEGGVGVEGNLNAGGNANITGGLLVGGNTALGNDIAADTVAITAKVTIAGALVTTPSSTLDITVGTGITATHIQRSYLKVRSAAGAIDLNGGNIAAGSPGQMMTLQGMDNVQTIRLVNSAGLVLAGGIPFTLRDGHIMQLVYDGSAWRELFRTVPAP